MIDPDRRLAGGPPPETRDELYDFAPCGYLTTGQDGTIVQVNETLLRLLGERREALLGRPIQNILTPTARVFYENDCAPILTRHDVLPDVPLELSCAAGNRLPALLTWRRVDDAGGAVLGYRVMVVNARERVAYQQALLAEQRRTGEQEAKVRALSAEFERRVEERSADRVEALKMESLGQLTGGVAHDFNNLLTPILISLDLLHRRYVTDERALRLVGSALSAAERARTLVARLLAFARRQHLRPQTVDLAGLINAMSGRIHQTIGRMVTMRTNLVSNLPPARVDQSQLEAALLNLCINARDAMAGGGALTIAGDEVVIRPEDGSGVVPGRYVRLSVSDTGPGMNAETLRRAPEPFYSTKSVGKGTGLGLSMVYGLAAQSGGKLTLDSALGHGTTATIWLPVDQSVVTRDGAAASGSGTALPAGSYASGGAGDEQPLTVLLVDDDELVRFATAEMLTDLGHDVVQAASGMAALEALRQANRFDLLITDYLMPSMTGVELARLARLIQGDMPVLLITGYANIREAGSDWLHRLAKPFGTRDLCVAIGETLSGGLVAAT